MLLLWFWSGTWVVSVTKVESLKCRPDVVDIVYVGAPRNQVLQTHEYLKVKTGNVFTSLYIVCMGGVVGDMLRPAVLGL